MQYHQITSEERYAIAALRRQGLSVRAIARDLGRAPSTISREVARNRRADGGYRAFTACEHTRARRRRSRRNSHFGAGRVGAGRASSSPSTGAPSRSPAGCACTSCSRSATRPSTCTSGATSAPAASSGRHLRQASKRRRKRYGAYDSRGRLAGKRHISERPAEVETRAVVGHWEIDTVKGDDQARHTVVTLVERATGYLDDGQARPPHAPQTATARTHRADRPPRGPRRAP